MSRRRKIVIGCAIVPLALVLAFVFSARRSLFPEQLDVVSIKTTAAYQDPTLLERAYALPAARTYVPRDLSFQPNGSFCGPTTLANVFRSVGSAASTPDAVLEGSGKCSLGFCFGGLTLDELAEVARRQPRRRVTVLRDFALGQFREHVARSNDASRRYVVNFDRGPLFGKRGGHHSPIGGFLEPEGLVLVLDVNATYRPWLVPVERLFEAVDTVDPSSGLRRGLLLVE